MKVSVRRSGGFAGFTTTKTVHTDELSEDDAGVLRDLVHDARASTASPSAPPDDQPDRFQYELTVTDDDGTTHRWAASEQALRPEVATLARWVTEKAGEAPGPKR